jgi:ubiquinol-cytochrome c reductase cytochrome c subunit
LRFVAASLAACALGAAAQAPAGDAARGKAAYMKNMCYTCHGTVGQGTVRYGGRLASSPLPWEAFAQQVRRPRAAMPRYPVEFVSDAELADMVAYLASIKPGPKASEIPLLQDSGETR